MTTASNIILLAQAIGADVKGINTKIGTLANLTTTQKTNLVLALNELQAEITALESAVGEGAGIDDTTPSTVTTYSSTKTESVVNAAIAALLDSAPTTFDTLKEIADYIASDQTAMGTITTALGNRLRFDAAQTLTAPQQAQAGDNLGLGDPATDFVSPYNTAKA